jgi:hypothetical protein
MVTALIVIGVIAFLALDAYILLRVSGSHKGAEEYGAIAVPGETTVSLPTGKVKLTYQESYKASSTEDSIDFGVPGTLEVSVTSADGEALELKGPGFKGLGSSLSTGSGWSRALLIGTAEVAGPGVFTVTARPELEGATEPKILIGK